MNNVYDDNKDVMVTDIESILFKVNGVQYGRVMKVGFDAEDDIISCASIWGRDWIDGNNEDEKGKELIVTLKISGIS
eukprot:CAMPEP_0201576496 /NCGR_PEP_ID=MMETSP0190_2-20130828/22353_1 /ASSEMBLY_ACC=CAM_ASM_000263 /TAXON_ID=37353 /ORGANISM="Rosalina sp." /LENGTH=76 /DNA_ID=CAMNT_0048007411 /DNA_START=267 /DNA_END=497 /DNA_ORIENTATION=+